MEKKEIKETKEVVKTDDLWDDDLVLDEKTDLEYKALALLPVLSTPAEVIEYSRKHFLPLAFQTYLEILAKSKDFRLKAKIADTFVELSAIKPEKGEATPAVVLNLGREFLDDAAIGLKKALNGEKVIEVDLDD